MTSVVIVDDHHQLYASVVCPSHISTSYMWMETAEQLLEQGYDAFYYQGGNFNVRLSHAAFLELVRNRPSEFRTHKRRGSSRSQRWDSEWKLRFGRIKLAKQNVIFCSGAKRQVLNEQLEIRAQINELELICHSLAKKSPKCNIIVSRSGNERTQIRLLYVSMTNLSDTSSIIGDASTDRAVSARVLSTTETYHSVMSKQGGSTDDEVVSRSKLYLILPSAAGMP
ncbi:hypothetical protein Plhal304r1_c055g0141231 [Plasmopara halstedii]